MTDTFALTGAEIFDGRRRQTNAALLVKDGRIAGIAASGDIPPGCKTVRLKGGLLAPGFVDLQVNGGGGVLFNDTPTPEVIRAICAAHAQYGTTGLLVTLISDTPQVTARAIAAGIEAARAGVPGFLGLHLEGPHISKAKRGAHEAAMIRPMTDADMRQLIEAREKLPSLLVTVAAETVTPERIRALVKAGIKVSIGHSSATFEQAAAAFAAGASLATHLFNAMSPLHHREPGLPGAALAHGAVHAGIIADGFHVHRDVINIALRAKAGPGRIFLVTDAMSTIGTDMKTLTLHGRTIYRKDGRLVLEDGTLAGADLDMITAVRFMAESAGAGWDEALRMAALYPARALGAEHELGRLLPGMRASIVHLDDAGRISGVWTDGERRHPAE